MKKYCKFLKNIYDEGKLIWEKDQEYLITYEDKNHYTFGEHIKNDKGGSYAIGKDGKWKLYTVVEREEG